VSKKYFTEIL